jgi:hypothetical protein
MSAAAADLPIGPAKRWQLWTAHDTNVLPSWVRGISFVAAGDIALISGIDGETAVTIPNGALAAGVIHPIIPKIIKLTGTIASGFVLWG